MNTTIFTLLSLLFLQCINKQMTIYEDETIEVYFSKDYIISQNPCPMKNCLKYFTHESLPSEVMILDSGNLNIDITQWLDAGIKSLSSEKEVITNEVVDRSKNCQKALIVFKSDYKGKNSERAGIQLSSISLIGNKDFSRGIYWRHILPNSIENSPLLQSGLEFTIRNTLINAKCNKNENRKNYGA